MQASNTTSGNSISDYNNAFSSSSSSSSSLLGRNNNQILERFLGSIRSDVTREGVLSYINAYMRFYHLYEGQNQVQEQGLLSDNNNINKSKKNTDSNSLIYRYDWLICEDIQTIQNKLIDFVNHKKKEGISSKGINNYISPLQRFYRILQKG